MVGVNRVEICARRGHLYDTAAGRVGLKCLLLLLDLCLKLFEVMLH